MKSIQRERQKGLITMKKNIKKQIIGGLTALSLVAVLSSGCVMAKNSSADNADAIKVTYNGEAITFDVQPEIVDDRVLVPMRAIFETLGAKVKWDGDSQTITSKKKSKTISMTIGSTDMTKDDETYTFDVSPVIEDGRTLVPLRAISELLGLNVEWNADTKTVTIESSKDDESWKDNTGTIELATMKVTGEGISTENNLITITSGGDFTVTGVSDNGQIVIDTEEKVKLRLSGMSLTNPTGSAIYVKNADKAYITIADGTENTLTDGETYTSGDENEKGTITSRDNLEIKGKGKLTINANYKNGIDASDSLDIENGNITITAKNDGINVNDTLTVTDGTINITAESDGMQAGDIVDVQGGTINITTTGDVPASTNNGFGGMGRGMQQTQTTEDTSSDVTSKGIKADWLIDISGGTVNLTTTDHAIHCASDIEISGGDITIASDNKGISAHEDLTINGGSIDITKSSEGIESKAIMTINDGDISVIASDDGLNAGGSGDTFGGGMGGNPMGGMSFGTQDGQTDASSDGTQQQNMGMRGGRGMRGNMNGQQGMTPPEMNGEMPSDMQGGMTQPEMNGEMPQGMQQGGRGMGGGMNGQQGMTPPEMNGEMPSDMQQMTPPDMQSGDTENQTQQGRGSFGGMSGGMSRDSDTVSAEHHIQINGGTVYINAMGDGIDSNGSIVIDGGTVTVDGTTNGGNSALDHDGTMKVNGGTLIAVSALVMVEAPGSYSEQNVLNYSLSESVSAGTEISVKNSSGKTIVTHKSANAYQSFIYSSDELVTGETYTIYVGGEEKDSFTVSDTITTVGTATGTIGGRGAMGGQRGMQNAQQTTGQSSQS